MEADGLPSRSKMALFGHTKQQQPRPLARSAERHQRGEVRRAELRAAADSATAAARKVCPVAQDAQMG
jgi:hypothetical protein